MYLDFAESIERLGRDVVEERYGNLFEMYERITGEDPYVVPMRIYPAIHYTMGGLWVDYDLMSNVPGLFVLGEANFSDHGANRLGRVGPDAGSRRRLLRAAVHDRRLPRAAPRTEARCRPTTPRSAKPRRRSTSRSHRLLSINGKRTVDDIHRELGKALWDNCGMSRTEQSLTKALSEIPAIREEFWKNVRVLGENETRNQSLEKAGRVADFLEFGELLVPRRAAPQRDRAAATSARSTAPRTAKRSATTSTSRTSPRGSTRVPATNPCSTRSSSSSNTPTRRPRSYK